ACSYNASNGMDSRSESFADRLLQQRLLSPKSACKRLIDNPVRLIGLTCFEAGRAFSTRPATTKGSQLKYFKPSPGFNRMATLCVQFPLSVCNEEDPPRERGIEVRHETLAFPCCKAAIRTMRRDDLQASGRRRNSQYEISRILIQSGEGDETLSRFPRLKHPSPFTSLSGTISAKDAVFQTGTYPKPTLNEGFIKASGQTYRVKGSNK
ncbi:hypothetical protein RXV88_19130, partial [Aestuariicoccus sp. MJ-SS9]|nr:hypothetical protein [Aestuariicoccus sp. MJ-SS9]